jgi:gluconate 5-dehydrogenase
MRRPSPFDLTGKRAIVTGGGSGLGLQIAEGLAEAGCELAICARNLERCEGAARHLAEQFGVRAIAQACPPPPAERLGGIEILVNNSGTSWSAPAIDYPLAAWEKVIAVNLTGTFRFTQAVAGWMIDHGAGGKVINIASVLGFRGAPAARVDVVGYSASKGGVIAMTRDLAVKWAPQGILVNAISPGWFQTEMSADVLDRGRDSLLDRIPLGRFGGAEDLKAVAVFLAGPGSDFIVGQTIVVDGGQSVS